MREELSSLGAPMLGVVANGFNARDTPGYSYDSNRNVVVSKSGQPVYPNQFLQVNTIFDVAHQAGLYTAFSDKHPSYQIASGNDPNAINDFYGPEINSTTALLDPTTGKTVDANALLAATCD